MRLNLNRILFITILSATMTACSTNPVVDNNKSVATGTISHNSNTPAQSTVNTNSTDEYTYTGSNTTYDNSNTEETNSTETIDVVDKGNYVGNAAQKGFVVQLTASISEAKTNKIKNTFAGEGYSVIQNRIDRNGQILYRVQIGPYISKEEAKSILTKMKTRYKNNIYIKTAFVNENK
ncbi:MAG: SPOR domain-containing protein [Cocleimonas sp.]|nr:SPOR domain-containing protein [Cocleimonas sp.]